MEPSSQRLPDWPQEVVARFWDYRSTRPHLQQHAFSQQVGDGIARLLHYANRLQGRVLDFGAGPGYLLQSLLKHPIQAGAVEFSRAAVDAANQQFKGRPNWLGAETIFDLAGSKLASEPFDLITCIEVVEHLSDAYLHSNFEAIHRLLKPTGTVLVTTPFNENLTADLNYCPFCDHEFHKIQHVRAWNVESLSAALEQEHFKVLYCAPINLWDFQRMTLAKSRGWAPGRLLRMIKLWIGKSTSPHDLSYLRHARRGTHLIALAQPVK
jgi:2-polyprenyl-3-methyl-5-hydroxy-6-metoxy-1,4-benzoquinol methylase